MNRSAELGAGSVLWLPVMKSLTGGARKDFNFAIRVSGRRSDGHVMKAIAIDIPDPGSTSIAATVCYGEWRADQQVAHPVAGHILNGGDCAA